MKMKEIRKNEGEEKGKAWRTIREYNRITPIASNLIVNHIFFMKYFKKDCC